MLLKQAKQVAIVSRLTALNVTVWSTTRGTADGARHILTMLLVFFFPRFTLTPGRIVYAIVVAVNEGTIVL